MPQLNIAMNVYVGKQDLITILLKALINFQGALEWVDANRLCDLDYADVIALIGVTNFDVTNGHAVDE